MLEIKFVRQNLELIKESTLKRGLILDWDFLKSNDVLLREITHELEELRHNRNAVSNKIAKVKQAGNAIDDLVVSMSDVSSKIKALEKKAHEIEDLLMKVLLSIPNVAHSSVPFGDNEDNNVILKMVGNVPNMRFTPLPHWISGNNLGLFDLNRASKIAGSRFPLLIGAGARLERALINFMLDVHTVEHGYCEILPPFIVNRRSLIGTGQLPKFEQDLFKIEGRDSFLIPTAEVPVINIHQDEILEESQLPIFYVAYSPCFRSEAGSYGKDVKGLIRQHQFNKVELIKFSVPETSYAELETLLSDAESILKRLELHYRVITLCTGDLGFSASKTYDIEVWMPFHKKYREISSCSNLEAFQARRANIRVRQQGKKGTRLLHTLNGSGLAVGRTMAAIIENYQQEDGSLLIPRVLRPYMGGMEKIHSYANLKS